MKILIISCYSPMINNSAAIESLTYLKALNDLGHEIDLLTVDFKENSIYYDKNILRLIPNDINIHRVSAGILFEKMIPKKSSTKNKKGNKTNILKLLKNRILIPDAYCFWINNAYKYYIKNLDFKNFDVILSMHEPASSHLVALKIKKKRNHINWIAYFSDPWTSDRSRINSSFLRKIIENDLEKNVIKRADKYIFVTEGNKKDFIDRYNLKEKNIAILTRSYDKEFYDILRKEKFVRNKGKLNILYTGEIFSNIRDIKPFLECLKSIKTNNNKLYKSFNVEFFGNVDDENIINHMRKIDNLTLNPRISFKEAVMKTLNSDILLLFGNKGSKQIPAKLYDYLGANSAILVILADNNDPLKNICKDIDKCFVCDNNMIDIENQLYNIVNNINNGIIYDEEIKYSYFNFVKNIKDIIK